MSDNTITLCLGALLGLGLCYVCLKNRWMGYGNAACASNKVSGCRSFVVDDLCKPTLIIFAVVLLLVHFAPDLYHAVSDAAEDAD